MKQYFGILALLTALMFSYALDKIIAQKEIIIQEFIDHEMQTGEGNVSYFKDYNKRKAEGNPTARTIINLFDQIKNSPPYSNRIRKELLATLKEETKLIQLGVPNINLFNKYCLSIIRKHDNIEKRNPNVLLVDNTNRLSKDSFEISFYPILLIDTIDHIEYYINEKQVPSDKFKNHKGSLKDLKVTFVNPISGETYTVK